MATAATLAADTLEQQLVECVKRIRIKQITATNNPDGINFVTAMNRNEVTGVLTISLTIPTTDMIDPADGSIDYTAIAVYTD
ncbi:MAG TPA: hypothetical protein VFM18_23280 [Methanosarcina sp.]|nr:hypothetical protein [Methanosarcina sp.]